MRRTWRVLASRQWLREFLDPAHLVTSRFWGDTAFVHPPEGRKISKMVTFVTEDVAAYTADQRSQLDKVLVALSAEAKLVRQADDDARDAARHRGRGRSDGGDRAWPAPTATSGARKRPVDRMLDGWASRQWMIDFLHNPAHPRFYGKANDRMPAYGEKGELSPLQIGMVVDWLRGEAK